MEYYSAIKTKYWQIHHKHYAKWKKSDPKMYTMWFHFNDILQKVMDRNQITGCLWLEWKEESDYIGKKMKLMVVDTWLCIFVEIQNCTHRKERLWLYKCDFKRKLIELPDYVSKCPHDSWCLKMASNKWWPWYLYPCVTPPIMNLEWSVTHFNKKKTNRERAQLRPCQTKDCISGWCHIKQRTANESTESWEIKN